MVPVICPNRAIRRPRSIVASPKLVRRLEDAIRRRSGAFEKSRYEQERLRMADKSIDQRVDFGRGGRSPKRLRATEKFERCLKGDAASLAGDSGDAMTGSV